MIQYLSGGIFLSNDILENLFDLLQELKTQRLLDAAFMREFIDDVSKQFDYLDHQIEAIKKQLLSDKENTKENLEELIKQEEMNSLGRQLFNATKRLYHFLEVQATMGLETPYQVIAQIEQAEEEIKDLRQKIERLGRGIT